MKEDAIFALIFVASLGIGYLLPSVDAASRSGAAGALGATLLPVAVLLLALLAAYVGRL